MITMYTTILGLYIVWAKLSQPSGLWHIVQECCRYSGDQDKGMSLKPSQHITVDFA